jgi:hypothetical protein
MSISDTESSPGPGAPTVSRDLCVQAVQAFGNGWNKPHPHAWDDLLAADVQLHQPLMPDGVGLDHWQREFARLQAFLPDLQGQVLDWAQTPDGVLIHLRCSATAGGRPLTFDVVDRLHISTDGAVVRRMSFFDPTPLVGALLTRPRAWRAWWLSGMAPLTMRRAILSGDRRDPGGVLALGLGLTRTALGLAIFVRPRLVSRSLGFRSPTTADVQFAARAFAARDFSIGLTALSPHPKLARVGLRLGLIADTADTISILLGRHHGLTRRTAMTFGAATAALAAAGIRADRGFHERGRSFVSTLHQPSDDRSKRG